MLNFSLQYLNLLKTRFDGLNLTRILDDQEFYEKQILDSILPYEQSPEFKSNLDRVRRLLDVGFGGGFPIVPLAKHCPHIEARGLESRSKKVDAVNIIAQELKLPNVKVYHHRLDEVLINCPVVITFKAVGTVMDFLPMIQVGSVDINVYFYKGPSYAEKEQPEFEKKLAKHWTQTLNQRLSIPGTEERRLIGFKAKNVPRGTSKTLVNLSELF